MRSSRYVVKPMNQAMTSEILDLEWDRLAILASNDFFNEIDLHFGAVSRVSSENIHLLLRESKRQHAVLEAILMGHEKTTSAIDDCTI
jgi:hypothetical protein